MRVSGFTIVRNAVKLNYPFAQAVHSAIELCDEFVINCGDSDDGTLELCLQLQKEFPEKIRIIESRWEQDSQTGGFQLKHQSDAALKQCQGRWCLYIQADEALHEKDHPALRTAMGRADSRPDIDGLVFEYRHFYGSYDYEIRGRSWYRREVRLFKNGRDIEAYRDAQGFRRNGQRLRVFPANARVFHYGYVRSPSSLDTKAQEMARWWGTPAAVKAETTTYVRHIGLCRYKGSHPRVMQNKLEEPNSFDPKKYRRRWDKNEIKNALTLLWETFCPIRIGEFRNYEISR